MQAQPCSCSTPPGTDLQLQLALLRAALLGGAEAVFEGFLRLREAPEERMHQSVELLRLHGDGDGDGELSAAPQPEPHSPEPQSP